MNLGIFYVAFTRAMLKLNMLESVQFEKETLTICCRGLRSDNFCLIFMLMGNDQVKTYLLHVLATLVNPYSPLECRDNLINICILSEQ